MKPLIVTDAPEDWVHRTEPVEVVAADAYLTQPEYSTLRSAKVFNLCRSYRYQSIGYYVSLLAEARGHRPLPSVTALQDLKTQAVVKIVSSELDELIQHSLGRIRSDRFVLSIYFGRNLAKHYDRLCSHLFAEFQAPLLRAHFQRDRAGWQLKRLNIIAANEVPEAHWPFLRDVADRYFRGRGQRRPQRATARFDLAILVDPAEKEPPSNEKALRKFVKAAERLGIAATLVQRDDFGQLAEYDGLFLRETTAVNHHTYRFARRAARDGLVVIDDPLSIVRCTNKVFLSELLSRHKVPTPKTLVVHRHNVEQISQELGFPVVLKRPDSSFSQGVVKVSSEGELVERVKEFLERSELIVAQEFLPTEFDWRIGILDRQPLYAAKYFMAKNHWQIIHQDRVGPQRYGKSETVPVGLAPRRAVSVALRAANLIGDGLYGVDVKQSGGQFYVIEVNDNPNLDAGYEDAVLKDELYLRVMQVFLHRMEQKRAARATPS